MTLSSQQFVNWIAAWNNHDADAALVRYGPSVHHRPPFVRLVTGGVYGHLGG